MNLYEVLRRPLVTEKSTRLSEAGTYVFEVDKKASDLVKAGKNEEARQFVTAYTAASAYSAMRRWEEIRIELWGMLGRGF